MRLALLLIGLAAAVSAQPAPAIDFATLLEQSHRSTDEGHRGGAPGFILFPRAAADEFEQEVEGEAATLYPDGSPARVDKVGALRQTDHSAIRELRWASVLPQDRRSWPPVADGREHTYVVRVGDDLIGQYAFTPVRVGEDDPYTADDDRRWTVQEGPWYTHSFFQHVEGNERYMSYFMWLRPEDRLAGKYEVSLRRNGTEVAWGVYELTASHISPNSTSNQLEFQILAPDARHRSGEFGRWRSRERWGIGSVTPGPYQVVVTREDGEVVSRVVIEGAAGAFVPHPRSALDYAPRWRFLTPMRAVTNGSQVSRELYNLYWIAPDE